MLKKNIRNLKENPNIPYKIDKNVKEIKKMRKIINETYKFTFPSKPNCSKRRIKKERSEEIDFTAKTRPIYNSNLIQIFDHQVAKEENEIAKGYDSVSCAYEKYLRRCKKMDAIHEEVWTRAENKLKEIEDKRRVEFEKKAAEANAAQNDVNSRIKRLYNICATEECVHHNLRQ